MAAVKSRGVHIPVALPYLVAEGHLPPDPKPDQYQWETYLAEDGAEDVEEELLATKNTVVWSQGRFIRNIYRFHLEEEEVVQAVLTSFPVPEKPEATHAKQRAGPIPQRRPSPSKHNSSNATHSNEDLRTPGAVLARALVVLLKTKAQIHFLKGASHVLDLPFEVERAFAAPRGLILQRKRTPQHSVPPTPQVPRAPPNSFFSSQGLPGSSLRHPVSPTLVKSFARASFSHTKPFQPSPLGGDPKLDALFQEAITAPSRGGDDDVTNIYSLGGPLSELGVVTYSLQHYKPRVPGKGQPGLSVEFEGLEPGEQIIYISPKDELSHLREDKAGPLILLVTFNSEVSTVKVWHAWYVEDKSLKGLLKARADQKEAVARRRSSFMNGNIGASGAATPGLRRRDGTRESFAAPGQLQPDTGAPQGATASRKPTRQEEEEVMVSQMDPDYLPAPSQQPVRESRRISSMNADVRASQNTVNASFGAAGGRRATSFGGSHSRRSLSHRKSRGSTPGSVYGHSLGGDDETMDVDTTIEFDADESLDEIVRHIRATFDASGMDSIFGGPDEGFKRELVVRKIHSFPVSLSTSSQGSTSPHVGVYKAVTLAEPALLNGTEDARLKMLIHDRETGGIQQISLKIKQCLLWPHMSNSPWLAVPLFVGESKLDSCEDILKLQDGHVKGILLGTRGVQFSLDEQAPFPLQSQAPYRVFDALELLPQLDQSDVDVGRNRTLTPQIFPLNLQHSGSQASYDETSQDGPLHRRKLLLRAESPQIESLLAICEIILPKQNARVVRKTWCMIFSWLSEHSEHLSGTASDPNLVALVSTMFVFVIDILDPKARAALNISKVAAGRAKGATVATTRLQKSRHHDSLSNSSAWSWMPPSRYRSPKGDDKRRDHLLVISAAIADEMSTSVASGTEGKLATAAVLSAAKLMSALHIYREEQKLSTLTSGCDLCLHLAPVIAQLGLWLGLEQWSPNNGRYYDLEGANEDHWAFVKSKPTHRPQMGELEKPTGVFQWFENSVHHASSEPYPTLSVATRIDTQSIAPSTRERAVKAITPRTTALSNILASTSGLAEGPSRTVELLAEEQITMEILETLPESIAAPFREAISRCEKEPPTTWHARYLRLVGRDDLDIEARIGSLPIPRPQLGAHSGARDVQTACHTVDHPALQAKTKEAGRHAISQLIFSEDRRLVEAISLMHFNSVQVAQCPRQPEWDETAHFEHQRKVMHWVTIRMIALPAGDGMLHFDSQTPLLTERYHLPGFSSSCLMQPMGHTLTADRTGLTEEKVNWAYFHAGVSAGLRISRNVKGIDTSWIAFNKPSELTNRHAGLLLALGLGGHLRQLAKWLSFKYLTPKHTMTSVGVLLGLSASYLGTMDGLVTRMLSVHITRMLPAGAAELNVTPATQTAGLMGVGLLYYNTQHRRMSEIMLSEIEHMEIEDPDSGPDMLRDESYRLSAGFALGLINLGKGDDLRGLHGMQLPERLLAIAVGPRPVTAVHVFDRATAGAVVAIALVYMKSGDRAVAQKIDIPDTEAQFDQVRPDILMLRAMARHIITWDNIEARGIDSSGTTSGWIHDNLPACYKNRSREAMKQMLAKHTIDSAYIPLFNVFTGLAWALALKHAGSGNELARDEILDLLKFFHRLSEGADAYYFDGKLGRSSLRRCMDVLALCAAMVMAGTGDLETFRYLRRMHGRTDPDTPYGSHLAGHLAIGVLFLGGGTFSFGTSDLAIASLICAFYPLFPTDVHDNRVHLQAFRHLWVFAAEARCIVVEDIDTHRPIEMPIKVIMRDGTTRDMKAPCLLPELETVASVHTDNSSYWRVTLDFVGNPVHLSSFRKDQRVFVRRCPAGEAHSSIFSAALAALTDAQTAQATNFQVWHTLFRLPGFKDLDRADLELLLPADVHSSMYTDERGTVVDDRLVMSKAVNSGKIDELWNLRLFFAWAERCRITGDGRLRWVGQEVVEALKARIEERARGLLA